MTPSLPVPTDNIHKFRALFGLTLMIVAIFSFCSVYGNLLEQRVTYAQAAIPLAEKKGKTAEDESYLKLYENLFSVSKTNERAAQWLTLALFAAGFGLWLEGMWQWKTKVQKRDDRIAELQELKLQLEAKKLEAEISQLTRSDVG